MNELAHAADPPLQRRIGLMFLRPQEKQKGTGNAATKPREKSAGVVPNAAPWPAVPLRLAALAAAERQAKEHPHDAELPRKGSIMKQDRKFIFRQHVRVARNELPWVLARKKLATPTGLCLGGAANTGATSLGLAAWQDFWALFGVWDLMVP